MSTRLLDDCFRPGQSLLRHQEALDLLKGRLVPMAGLETVDLGRASGRILAAAAVAHSPVPAHTNSAVDGYAFGHPGAGLMIDTPRRVAGRAAAGRPFGGCVPAGEAVRIFTGAVMPAGTDTVIMQEDTEPDAAGLAVVRFKSGRIKKGANVRQAGEDVAAGATLIEPGTLIRPQDIAALASIGLASVDCRSRLKIGIVSTGDEVVRAGARGLGDGEVYDANAPMLAALCANAGCDVHDLGIWPDRADIVQSRLADAAREFDVLLTSGGASAGEEDHMAGAIAALGSRHFWRIQVKPGRPMMFGQITSDAKDTVVVGLPGNPVAVFVCFLMYVWPMLRRLGGAPWPEPRRLRVPAAFAFPNRKSGRREYWRGMLSEADDGLTVDKYARDGSGLISSLRAADCLIEIPEDAGSIASGDAVTVIPFSDFGIL